MKFNRINIEITNVCNLKCSFCVEPERKVGFMTEALFRKVLTEVAPLTRIITFHVLGEPLLHPEIGKFISLANDAGLKVFLVTNGTLIKKRAKELLHPALRQINFSLHSYGHSGNKGSLQDYLFPIFAWTEAAFELYPRLFINYRIWDLNERGETVGSHEAILTEIEAAFGKKLPRTLEEKKNFIIKNRLSLHFDTEFDWPSLKSPWVGGVGSCHGLSSHFGILTDGTVVPCCLDKDGNIPLGNVNTRPLKDILRSDRAKRIREGFLDQVAIEPLCQHCSYRERFGTD